MTLEKLESVVSRLFFFGAFVLLALALIERIANYSGYTFLQMRPRAGTVLETSVVLLVFVIAIQLREIREALKRKP
jgi:hypothetical protein